MMVQMGGRLCVVLRGASAATTTAAEEARGGGQMRRCVVSLGVSHGEDATTIVCGPARCVAFMATDTGRINKDRVSRARTHRPTTRSTVYFNRRATTGLAPPATDQLFRAEVSCAAVGGREVGV